MPLFGNKPVMPKEFLCPLSTDLEAMAEPVLYQGVTYERANIVKQLKKNGISENVLVENIRLKQEIADWKKKHGLVTKEVKPVEPVKERSFNDYDYILKIMLLGDSGAGKSCLLLRYIDDSYTESFISTIGVDFKIKTIDVEDKILKLQIWDTAGQERFRTIQSAYVRCPNAVVLVFDLTDLVSFNNVTQWFAELDRYLKNTDNLADKVILVGCKSDLKQKRVVTEEQITALTNKIGVRYFETSAKENLGIDTAFASLAASVIKPLLQQEKQAAQDKEVARQKEFMRLFKENQAKRVIPNPFCTLSRTLFFGGRPTWAEIQAIAQNEPQSLTAETMNQMNGK